MNPTPVLFPFILLFGNFPVFSQDTLPVPLNIQKAVNTGSRTMNGMPGNKYWQNRADYSIRVSFNPSSRLISGTESILYVNNSPDTIRSLLFKLYPNVYQKGAIRDSPVKPQDLMDGVVLSNLKIDQVNHSIREIPEGTNLRIPISNLLPGHSLRVALEFSYILNKTSHNRTGAVDSSSFFIAYFFPRIAVYDDIDGWNNNPYTGAQEFYNDFCHFSVTVTVPDNYLVWATGDLKNKEEVLQQTYIKRLAEAEESNSVIKIIDSSEQAARNVTLHHTVNIWKFEADDVTDFVFATSNHYCWNACSVEVDHSTKKRTRVDVAFNPLHSDYYPVIDFARKTVDLMSYQFPKWPFPYPHETIFDGLDQMEYPMMVNDNPLENKADAITLTIHEIFHTMFPFYTGINETKYGWMDEGWATISEWLLSAMIDSSIKDKYGMEAYNFYAGKELDLPVTTLSTQLTEISLFLNSYPKPALGYLFVKDMLGDSVFLNALHNYISNWKGKHPGPLDFFNSMNQGSRKNINWFWKRWFYDEGYPDLAFGKVSKSGAICLVEVLSIGTKPVPVDLTIYFEDHTTQFIHRDISCWQTGNRQIQISFTAEKKISKLILGSLYIPDVNSKDNEYTWPQ
jgi:Peptidase family M1 domain